MNIRDLLNPTIIHRPFDTMSENFAKMPGDPAGRDLEKDEIRFHFSKRPAIYNSLSLVRSIFYAYILGGWRLVESYQLVLSGQNESRRKLICDGSNIEALIFIPFLTFVVGISGLLLIPVNLIKLMISPVTVLPYFLYKHGLKSGLKKSASFIFSQLEAFAANLIGMVVSVTLLPMALIIAITPFSRRAARRRMNKHNQNHPTVQAVIDAAAQDDNIGMQQAIDRLLGTEEFSVEQTHKFIYVVTRETMQNHPTAVNAIRGLMNHSTGFKAAVDEQLYYKIDNNNQGPHEEILNLRINALLDSLSRENVLQEAYHILKYCIPYTTDLDKLENLVDHIVTHHRQMMSLPTRGEREELLRFLVRKCNTQSAALKSSYEAWVKGSSDLNKPFQMLLNLLNVPEFFDTVIGSTKHVVFFKVHAFVNAIGQIDLSENNNAAIGCCVLRALVLYGEEIHGSDDISWAIADIRCLVEKKEICDELLNGHDTDGVNNLKHLVMLIRRKHRNTQNKLLFPLLENAEIKERLKLNHGESTIFHDGLQQLEQSVQESAAWGKQSGPTKTVRYGGLYSGRPMPVNTQESTDDLEERDELSRVGLNLI